MRTASSCIVVLAIVIAAMPASAQTAEGEVLFREGQRLMKAGKIAEACEKFEASEKLEPAFGTEYDLGNCREQNEQFARAWAAFLKAEATAKAAKRDDRVTAAHDRASKLEGRLVYLTIKVPAETAVEDLVVKRNNVEISRSEWDMRVPVDPDEYIITAEAPGYAPWSDTVNVRAKDKVIEVPPLERAAHRTKPKRPKADVETIESPRKYGTATIALAAGGLGALALGTGFAIYSSNVETQSDTLCPSIRCGDPHALDLNRTARLDATIANISWGLGGAALIGAGILWYVGGPAVVPVVDRDRAGVAFGGRF